MICECVCVCVCVQSVVRAEQQLGGRLLVKPRPIQFHFGGSNLCVSVEQLSSGWRCKLPDNIQVT